MMFRSKFTFVPQLINSAQTVSAPEDWRGTKPASTLLAPRVRRISDSEQCGRSHLNPPTDSDVEKVMRTVTGARW
jgi:hypothetical protein